MSAQPRILVVEDDILIGTHIADTLSVSGYASHLVTSLPEALSALSAQSFDAGRPVTAGSGAPGRSPTRRPARPPRGIG